MFWYETTATGNGNYRLINTDTHDVKPKQEWYDQQIEEREILIKRLTKRMTEIIGEHENDIEELKKEKAKYYPDDS